jgi:integrase
MKIIKGETRGRPGRWLLDFRDETGKRRWETFRTQKAAKDALSLRLEQLRKGTYHAPAEVPTLETVAQAWLVAKQDRRPSSVDCDENYVVAHIAPRLGHVRLNRVTVAAVESLREDLRKGLSPRTVNKILAALSAIFDHAIKHGLTEKNPAPVVDRVKLDTAEVSIGDAPEGSKRPAGKVTTDDVPTAEEVIRLLDAAEPGRSRTFLLLAVHSGAREGELLALTWDDLDLDRRTLAIRRTISWAKTRGERAEGLKGPRFYEPKTRAGRRTLELPEEVRTRAPALEARVPALPYGPRLPDHRGSPSPPPHAARRGSRARPHDGGSPALHGSLAAALRRVGSDPPKDTGHGGCGPTRACFSRGDDGGLRALSSSGEGRGDERHQRCPQRSAAVAKW